MTASVRVITSPPEPRIHRTGSGTFFIREDIDLTARVVAEKHRRARLARAEREVAEI